MTLPATAGAPESGQSGLSSGWSIQACGLSHVSAFVRDALPGGWLRHSYGTRASWAQGRQHDDGVYPCAQPWRAGSIEPGRSAVEHIKGRKTVTGCGLIARYPAKLAALAREERFDKMNGTSRYCGQFFGLEGNLNLEIYGHGGGSKLS